MENLQEHNRVEKETTRSLDQAAKNNKSGVRRIILWFLAMLIGGILGYLLKKTLRRYEGIIKWQ